jgi:ribosomal protein S18 acetylase RimI-like enzyme
VSWVDYWMWFAEALIRCLELSVLVVSPKYQRRGIGTLLLEDGLKRADEAGLQAVLGASPEGIGLYRRYGFVDFEIMDFKLWEYEGGEGLGTARAVIMHRPAVVDGSSKNR